MMMTKLSVERKRKRNLSLPFYVVVVVVVAVDDDSGIINTELSTRRSSSNSSSRSGRGSANTVMMRTVGGLEDTDANTVLLNQ